MPKKTKYRVRNWCEYNKALVSRGSLTVWFSEDAMKHVSDQVIGNAHGNQRYSDGLIECCLRLKEVYRMTLRATEGFMQSLLTQWGLNIKVPDYTTLSRRAARLKVDLCAREKSQARHILVDSTGVQVIGGSEWKTIRHGKKGKQLWRKLHIAVDANTLDICSAIVTESQRSDGNYLRPLIEAIHSPVSRIVGDGAYDKKSCYQVAYERGAEPVFPPQYNAVVQRNRIKKEPALLVRDELIQYLNGGKRYKNRLTRWKNKNNYHRRSLVETTMSRLKHLFGDQVRSRRFENQTTDLMIRCSIINKMNDLGLPDTVKVA